MANYNLDNDMLEVSEHALWNNTKTIARDTQCIPYFKHETYQFDDIVTSMIMFGNNVISAERPTVESEINELAWFLCMTDEVVYYSTMSRRKLGYIRDASYLEFVKKQWIEPLLIFIDDKFVHWEKIRIYDDGRSVHFMIDIPQEDVTQIKIDILHLPFFVDYITNNKIIEDESKQLVFIFDDNGCFDYSGHTRLYTKKLDHMWYNEGTSALGRVWKYDLNIPDEVHVYPENILVFKNGMLYRNANIRVDNYNALHIDEGEEVGNNVITYKIWRDLSSTLQERNIDHIPNHDQLKHFEYENTVPPHIFDVLNHEFDFNFDPKLTYTENLWNMHIMAFKYNYKDYLAKLVSTHKVLTKEYDFDDISQNTLGLDKWLLPYTYRGNCFIMIFAGGLLMNRFTIITDDGVILSLMDIEEYLDDSRKLEVVYLESLWSVPPLYLSYTEEEVGNTKTCVTYTEGECLLMCQWHPDKCFEMNDESQCWYTIGKDHYEEEVVGEAHKITFIDDTYANKDMLLVPSNVVQYQKFYLPSNNYRVVLNDRFNYCNKEELFSVYINGRRLNSNLFHVVVPSPVRPFNGRSIYFRVELQKGDYVEVIYSPMEVMDEVYIEDLDHSMNTGTGIDALGYITGPKNYPIPLSKELQFFFLNGKKIRNSDLMDISYSMIRTTRDHKSVEDLCIVVGNRNLYKEASEIFTTGDELSDMYEQCTKYEINNLTDTYSYITEAESARQPDFSKGAIVRQIVRDYYAQVNKGVPFRYTYDKDTFYDFDAEGNLILDIVDGNVSNNNLMVTEVKEDGDE